MQKIDKIKISLMEKDESSQENTQLEENENSYIIRSSATFDVNEYVSNHIKDKLNEEQYENFLATSSKLIYDELLDKNKNKNSNVNTVGVWITVNDDIFENSMNIDALQKIEEYGPKETNSIFELIKMTVVDEISLEIEKEENNFKD